MASDSPAMHKSQPRSGHPDPYGSAADLSFLDSCPYWCHQQQLSRLSRENSIPHAYARCAAVASKGVSSPVPTVAELASQLAKDDASEASKAKSAASAGSAASSASTSASTATTAPTATTSSGTAASAGAGGTPVTPAKKMGKTFTEKREHREEERQRHINEVIHHQFWTSLDCSGQGSFSVSPRIVNYPFSQKSYSNHNNSQTVPKCITELSQSRILDLSGNQISSSPAEIGRMSSSRVLLSFDNSLATSPYELGSSFQLQMLGIMGNPVTDSWFAKDSSPESFAQFTAFSSGGTRALIEYLRDNAPVGPPPSPRELIHSNPVTDPRNESSMMSYNTLCDVYASPQIYAYTPSWASDWKYRRESLIEEVVSRNMDIVCSQEVNVASLEESWSPVLEPLGYKSSYYQKTRSRTMSQQSEAKYVDGCATFYKHAKLSLIDKYPVEYNSKASSKDDSKKSEDIFNRVMSRDNIAIIGVFEVVSTGRQVVVANTHLHWDPAFRDVKLVQTASSLEETEKMARKHAKLNYGNDLKKMPVLIAGDFNSSADSGVVHSFNHSSVPPDHDDMAGHTYGNFTEHGISHNSPLKSAYPDEVQSPFTNNTPDFVEVIDYIVYSTPSIKVNALYGQIDPDYVKRSVAFPNAHNPSDHIPIALHFEFI